MSWRKLIDNERNIAVVGIISIASSGLYAFVLAGAARLLIEIDEESCFIWIGIPVFVILFTVHIFVLPKYLRKAGLID